jgi:cell division protein FtsI/penicillin-binding protein 2
MIMDPHTGGILASASFPNYDPSDLGSFETSTYKNPTIANTYEPGSTFKVLVMAAGIEAGVITPDKVCGSACAGPTTIGQYQIRTWNHEYSTDQTMTEVLANSDNTGMVFVAQELGKESFVEYIKAFGFGQPTGIDLQEETGSILREKWGDIDVATTSFGQGIAVTGIQMLRAVAAIANGGKLLEPHVVSTVQEGTTMIPIQPKLVKQVISPETAKQVTEMMIEAAHHGEAQWTVLKDYDIAGKTGTAQIPIDGHYDEEKTIASFVGFAPAYDPKFVMLVKLREPESSPWAAETAAPLWYQIAKDLLLYYNIPPNK